MRVSFLIFTFLLCQNTLQAQTWRNVGDLYELSFTETNAGKAHDSANVFAKEIGNRLKSVYPSKVVSPSVQFQTFVKDGVRFFTITWSCRIIRSSVAEADYYFDRRGTLLWSVTLENAKEKVETELKSSAKVSQARSAIKNSKIPESFIRDSFSGSSAEGYWYIKEFFLVAPK